MVLPGAVARGAYEAGVLEVLADHDLQIDRIVATSSGALNGLAYAAGIRAGNTRQMTERLVKTWIESGGWRNSLSLSPLSLFTGRGLVDYQGLLKMMRELIAPCKQTKRNPVELHVVVTPLNGVRGNIGEKTATTYEKLIKFSNEDFDTEENLERVFRTVSAACSFPGLFAPVELPGLGACIDGGAVNNAPIRSALDESGVSRVIMPVPFPEVMLPADWSRGLNLVAHLVEILINERLYRDLKEAQSVNHQADQLHELVKSGELTKEQCAKIHEKFNIRKVDITEVRPTSVLKGGTFSGFFSQEERRKLIEQGRAAANECLGRLTKNPKPAL